MFTSEKDSHRKAVSFLSHMVIDLRGLTSGSGHCGYLRYYIQVRAISDSIWHSPFDTPLTGLAWIFLIPQTDPDSYQLLKK